MFLEKSSKDMKVKLMQEAWALIAPSVKEGWGMVVTEAAACGTPAIVSNVTGLRDSVVNGKTGIVLSSNPTETEVSLAMLTLLEDRQLRNELSKEAIEFAKKFSWEKSFDTFYQLLIDHT